jgi:hypothetical protein
MANCSIPNSTPAIGRTSTPLSRRSRKRNSASASFFATLGLTIRPRTLRFFNAQLRKHSRARRPTPNVPRSIQTVGRWTLSVERWASSPWRVKGAWWSPRSSKPLSVPHTRDRGRFDSYPLRQISIVILSGAKRSRRIPWSYRKLINRASPTHSTSLRARLSLGMTNNSKGGESNAT